MSQPAYTFGGGSLTEAWREDNISELIEALQQAKIDRIDSAAIYPYTAPGGADRLLGSSRFSEKGFVIDTKALYFGDGSGTMTAEAIQKSLSGSLQSLGMKRVNVYYCHAPDKQTPIADQAAAMDAEYRKGSFSELGVSNFSAGMLQEWLRIADERGFVKPAVFQGHYNLLCRSYEDSLFPILRENNMSFAAYSPLAGGFLTGKVTFSSGPKDLKGTRFEISDTNVTGRRYRSFYDKSAIHEAIKKAEPICTACGITLTDAAIRWLVFHSSLDGDKGDTVITGPKNMSQLAVYVKARDEGPLPENVAKELDALWDEHVKEAAAPIIQY